MAFAVENIRLKELAVIAELNKPMFDHFVAFLASQGFKTLHQFVTSKEEAKAADVLLKYLMTPLPKGVVLYDGIARPYGQERGKWLLIGWILRDAPEQRLKPMVSSMPGNTIQLRQATILNRVRAYVGEIFPQEEKWIWGSISEVVIDRLEGSRRAIKGTLFEAIVRRLLGELFQQHGMKLNVSDAEIRLQGETYDVSVTGKKGVILIPVKTRETMGGGHAGIFTRDIHKSIHAAYEAGYECIPIIIAESWVADLKSLACKDQIYIDKNPNQVKEVEPLLAAELAKRLKTFAAIM